MKKEFKFYKKINAIPIFTGFIFAGILGITVINNDNHYANHSNDIQIRSNESMNENEKFTQVAMGEEHSSAITNEGNLYVWGSSYYGQLGTGATGIRTDVNDKERPWQITDNFNLLEGEKISQASMGKYFSSALTSEGNVYTWGFNDLGQLGVPDGSTNEVGASTSPIKITDNFQLPEGEKITQLDVDRYHSSALTDKGNVYTWGGNNYGQLGDGTTTNKHTPTKITDNFQLPEGETITSLSMGGEHSSALTSEGNLYTWGKNVFGQLGDNTTIDKHTPTKITDSFKLPDGETITKLNMSGEHSSALTNKGKVFTWGKNKHGQLGDNTTIDKHTPTNITDNLDSLPEGEEISQLSMSEEHSSALTSEGNVYTWGYNGEGQLGDGTTTEHHTPTNVTGNFTNLEDDEKIIQSSFNRYHSSVVTNKGNVYTWGFDNHLHLLGRSTDSVDFKLPGVIDFMFRSEILSDSISVTDVTTDSVKINFTVNKNDEDNNNDQNGNVVVRDGAGIQKGKKDNVNGSESIEIDGLTSNTTYNNWTIEVDGNDKLKIPEFTTPPMKSELSEIDPKNMTTNSVEIHFTVIKNDQDGNVVIRDGDGNQKGNEDNVDGPSSITINNLTSNTTYTGWTIEVDGNDKTPITDFTTTPIKSTLEDYNVESTTTNSVKINFEVKQNDGDGNVVIKDNGNDEKGRKDNVDGESFIIISGLPSNKKFTGWTIQVDDTSPELISDFNTAGEVSKLISFKVESPTVNSVKINFEVNKNDGDGDVLIKDNLGKEKGKKENVSGKGSIIIDDLTSNITYTGWTIDVDDDDKKDIPDFKTLKYSSNDIEKDVDIKIKGKLKDSDKQITFQYSQNKLDGTIHHIITYKDGTKQSTSPFYDNYFKGSGEKTYDLNQTIENISEIETIYTIDGYPVVLDSHTGSADKVLGDSLIKPGLSPGAIIGIVLAGLTGIMLILLMIYYFKKNNKMKKVKTVNKTKK